MQVIKRKMRKQQVGISFNWILKAQINQKTHFARATNRDRQLDKAPPKIMQQKKKKKRWIEIVSARLDFASFIFSKCFQHLLFYVDRLSAKLYQRERDESPLNKNANRVLLLLIAFHRWMNGAHICKSWRIIVSISRVLTEKRRFHSFAPQSNGHVILRTESVLHWTIAAAT